jgi:hypothetical protein
LGSDPPHPKGSEASDPGGPKPLPSYVNLPPAPSPDLPEPLTPPPPGLKLDAPPAPPRVLWSIHAYQWVQGGWIKQPDHCLDTYDLKQAADYCLELSRYPDWYFQANVPVGCCDPGVKCFYELPSTAPIPDDFPHTTMTVWAFKFADGKWVKDQRYCWSASDYYSL